MKYDYAYKRKAVEKYRKGEWMKTPERANETNFRQMIRKWVRLKYACSSEVLKQKNRHKEWSAEELYELVAKVLAGGKNHPTRVGTSHLLYHRHFQRKDHPHAYGDK